MLFFPAMHRRAALLIVFLVGSFVPGALLAHSALAQVDAAQDRAAPVVVRGTVTDAATGEALPSATLHVEGTFGGTITNAEGAFALPVERLPATLVIRYIGYETARVRVEEAGDAPLEIALRPAALEMGELVVEAGRNPADDIMREVIRRKAERRARLDTYRAEAYNRFTLRNDTGIVSLAESLTEWFWDKERGTREVVKSRRTTANLQLEQFLPAGLFITNLYDDDVEVGGYTLIGVTHPDALRHYDFELDSVRVLDGQRVFDIGVRPAGRLKSAFEGRVSVLDSAFALVEADLRPGAAFRFPPPVQELQIAYHQQFSDFGKDFWLPLALRSETEVKVSLPALLDVPRIRIDQVSRLANYAVNVPLPDSLYAEERYLAVDTAAVQSDTLLAASGAAVPLSTREAEALATIDSTMTLDKAYAPSGLLARFLQMSGSFNDEEVINTDDDAGENGKRFVTDTGLAPQLWFDRVDALNAAVKPSLTLGGRLRLEGLAGYKTGRREATYGAEAKLGLGKTEVFAAYRYGTEKRYDSRLTTRFFNSATVLLGGDDYFDYLGTERVHAGAERRLSFLRGLPIFGGGDARLRLTLTSARQFSVDRTTSYDLLGYDHLQPPNPPIPEGVLRSQKLTLQLGGEDGPLGFFGAERRLALSVESGRLDLGSTDLLGGGLFFGAGSDGDDRRFARFEGSADYTFETFFRRRLLPNELRLRLTGAIFAGRLPPQRFGIVDAGGWFFVPFGALKTLPRRPYEGEQHAAFFWEHNFRTVPFERVGLWWPAERGWSVLVHGGHARTWVSGSTLARLGYLDGFVPRVPDGFHHEIGLSLSGVLGIFRLDVSQRLDAPGTAFSIGAAQIF